MITLDYYYRRGCGLCDDMLRELGSVTLLSGIQLQSHDIDQSPALKQKYNDQVPVLAAGDTVICRYFFEEDSFREYLNKHA